MNFGLHIPGRMSHQLSKYKPPGEITVPNTLFPKINVLKVNVPKTGLLKKDLLLMLALFCLSACATVSTDTQQEKMSTSTRQLCTDPRPQVCPMVYDPVCATDTAGMQRTYASGCSACGRQEVVSYEKGACGKGAVQ